jgi:hypothetical protein
MTETYSPNLFLFQNYIEEVVKEGKKHIRTAPFDTVEPESRQLPKQISSPTIDHSILIYTMATSWPPWVTLKPDRSLASTTRNF